MNVCDRGIVLAGGSGSRLWPITQAVSKHLLPIYDKPLVYYPISVLMLAGVRDILLISTQRDLPAYQMLLGDGGRLGISIQYVVQANPDGIAQAFILGREFIGDASVALILGDNIFYGQGLSGLLGRAANRDGCATIFAHQVKEPQRYGIIELDVDGNPVSIEEKPQRPKSEYAVVGLYFYDNDVVEIAAKLRPSARGELEITDVNKIYLAENRLHVEMLGRGFTWLDAGTPAALLQASSFVESTESRQGQKIACLEEIAFRMGFISASQLATLAESYPNEYGHYFRNLPKTQRSSRPRRVL